jgi:hypothetical protein
VNATQWEGYPDSKQYSTGKQSPASNDSWATFN